MGKLDGHKQITLYMDPEIYERVVHVARMRGEPIYKLINDACARAIPRITTVEQRKALDAIMLAKAAVKRRGK